MRTWQVERRKREQLDRAADVNVSIHAPVKEATPYLGNTPLLA
jgi:hypothetical protein